MNVKPSEKLTWLKLHIIENNYESVMRHYRVLH
jgi:hypothetical protein